MSHDLASAEVVRRGRCTGTGHGMRCRSAGRERSSRLRGCCAAGYSLQASSSDFNVFILVPSSCNSSWLKTALAVRNILLSSS